MIFFKFASWLAKFPKRQRSVVATTLMSITILTSTFLDFDQAIIFLPFFLLICYLLLYLAILENINSFEKILLFLSPLMFAGALYLFYFFVPARWLTRLPFVVFFGVTMYGLILSQNIFNVGVEKSIGLIRVAFSINYLVLTIVSMLINIILLGLDINAFLIPILIALLHIPLLWQFIWSVEPVETARKMDIKMALLVALLMGELSGILLFIPLERRVIALVISTFFYSIAGLIQAHLQGRLFRERVREFVGVLIIIGLMAIFSAKW